MFKTINKNNLFLLAAFFAISVLISVFLFHSTASAAWTSFRYTSQNAILATDPAGDTATFTRSQGNTFVNNSDPDAFDDRIIVSGGAGTSGELVTMTPGGFNNTAIIQRTNITIAALGTQPNPNDNVPSENAYRQSTFAWLDEAAISSSGRITDTWILNASNNRFIRESDSDSCKDYISDLNADKTSGVVIMHRPDTSGFSPTCAVEARVAITLGAVENSTLAAGTGARTGDSQTSCAVEGVGWIVCPTSIFIATITDGAYALMEGLLVFSFADNALDTDNPVYTIWSNVRNLANIAFIFAFFMIIFSQSTSIGVSSYGIKKTLPRLVIAAILVNLSYFICVLGVDISNIIGAGLDGIIKSVPFGNGAGIPDDQAGNTGTGWAAAVIIPALAAGFGVAGVVGAGGVIATLAIALPFLVTALFAIITALVILVARQAILILLIVVSPLAFVAYILPNTESWFDKWKKLFITMLVFYPLVAVLFSGSQVAAEVLRLSANRGGWDDSLIKVFSLGVQIFPLFGLPFLLRFSGGVLGKIGGMVNNPNKGPFDKLRKKAERRRDTTVNNRKRRAFDRSELYAEKKARGELTKRDRVRRGLYGLTTRAQLGDQRANAKLASSQTNLKSAQEAYVAREASDPGFQRDLAGVGRQDDLVTRRYIERARTGAIAAEQRAEAERVKAYQMSYAQNPEGANAKFLGPDLERAIDANNKEHVAAAIAQLTTAGGEKGRAMLAEVLSRKQITDSEMQQTISQAIYQDNYSSLLPKRGDIAKGGFDNGVWRLNLQGVASEPLASSDTLTLAQNLQQAVATNDQAALRHYQTEASRIMEDENLRSKVASAGNLEIFEEMAKAGGATQLPDSAAEAIRKYRANVDTQT